VCDKARSDSPRPHLATLGLPELAIGAADKLCIALFIGQTARELSISHMSELGIKERKFVFGEEFREPSRDGGTVRFSVEQISATEIGSTVFMGNCRLAERKVLHSPEMLVQTVNMTVKGQAGGTTTTRVFVRMGDRPPPPPAPLAQ
jgi:hypothetical protein